MLTMISSPGDYPALDVEHEWMRLKEALSGIEDTGQLVLERLPQATLLALQRRLRKSEIHIFHYIGHGGFDDKSEDSSLLLEDGKGRGHAVNAQYLGMLLHDHRAVRLVVLNACEGARTGRSDPFAGAAQRLVQQGVPAVIAMQFEITDTSAVVLAHEFYSALAEGWPIDSALTEARKAIYSLPNDVEWGTPVLYMRSGDGNIFDFNNSRSENEAQSNILRRDQEKASIERAEHERRQREEAERARAENELKQQEEAQRARDENQRRQQAEIERVRIENEQRQREEAERARAESARAENELKQQEEAQRARDENQRRQQAEIERVRVENERRQREEAERARAELETQRHEEKALARAETERNQQVEGERYPAENAPEQEELERAQAEDARTQREVVERTRREYEGNQRDARGRDEAQRRKNREQAEAQAEFERKQRERAQAANERKQRKRAERERANAERLQREKALLEKLETERKERESAQRAKENAEAERKRLEREAVARASADRLRQKAEAESKQRESEIDWDNIDRLRRKAEAERKEREREEMEWANIDRIQREKSERERVEAAKRTNRRLLAVVVFSAVAFSISWPYIFAPLEPGIYIVDSLSRGDRLTPHNVKEVQGEPLQDRPTLFSDLKDSCVAKNLNSGARINWDDVVPCQEEKR
jgi:hypothetical protein